MAPQTSHELRQRIITLTLERCTLREIVAQTGVSRSTIKIIRRQWRAASTGQDDAPSDMNADDYFWPVVRPPAPSKPAGEVFSIRLTPRERAALQHQTRGKQ